MDEIYQENESLRFTNSNARAQVWSDNDYLLRALAFSFEIALSRLEFISFIHSAEK